MSTATMSMPAVVGFIQESADANDLDTVIEAVKARRKLLQDQAAAEVREGLDVTLYNLSRSTSMVCAARSRASNGSAASAPPW
ncbi:hypothetical protein [Haloechinothrix halophila]|uniref:hypothetical protein n=1 Tax=Haloechinothrix halophila TaxID=1069073 RepID=UPI0004264DB9|nr:hypothetical protein [Haloechinothrix halophila]